MPVYTNSNSAFYKTYLMYKEYIGYKKPYTYKQWMRLPDNFKAAALYVQFYDQITLAWYKKRTEWSIEEEGVEVINQYLIKNVEKIKKDKKRFKEPYIYKVAWNCLYCLCIDPSKNKERYEHEESYYCNGPDGEVSLLEFIGENVAIDDMDFQNYLITLFNSFEKINKFGILFDLYVRYKLEESTEYQVCRELKKFYPSAFNIKDKNNQKKVLSRFDALMKYHLQKGILEDLKSLEAIDF